eukprot:TRINITY_DN73647_c0_g1_i1.p1 TRINITY_DN73647_c0_g1~~TRINITY_DN73647_c0_g1_i1.p1  ORF type:complete len:810 (-),score=144.02 TRINITY_DN73647_c0_g1_i1:350-2779(-)
MPVQNVVTSVLLHLLVFACTAQEQSPSVTVSPLQNFGWLSVERENYCRNVQKLPPKLDEQDKYPAQNYDDQPNAQTRTLIQEYRSENLLRQLVRKCPLTDQSSSGSDCDAEVANYANSLLMFATPILAAAFFLTAWQTCCCAAMCRCCRRCCICAERKAPRDARIWQKGVIACVIPICIVAGSATIFIAYDRSGSFNVSIAEALCNGLTMADETLNGSPDRPIFLGIDTGIQRVNVLRQLLDVDGKSMTDVRAILDETAQFGSAMDDLLNKISHMKRVLTLVGQHNIKDHRCWFCERAAGSNSTGEAGMLNELLVALQSSSADAMRAIRQTTASTLTGHPLVDISAAVRRGGTALEVFKQSYTGTLVNSLLNLREDIAALEDARQTAFTCLSGFSVTMLLVVSNLAIWHARRSKAKYPTATPSCVSWFCGFCTLTFGLFFGGLMVLLAVPVSELCGFQRYDLLTHDGIQDYYMQIGLFNIADPTKNIDILATNVFRTCLTGNGTGDILDALQLRGHLQFQEVLDNRFVELEDKKAGMVVDTARYELLVTQAKHFGGLFLLDPDQPLLLSSNAAPKLMGSSLDPDDQVGPDGESLIYGLNTFASLIEGAGRYSFEHGTSGGGLLITASQPTPASVSNKPQRTQNALVYARMKEQILSEPGLFRCDAMDASYVVTETLCGYEQFKAHVIDMAEQVKAAGLYLGQEANAAKQLISLDLRNSIKAMMKEVRELRTLFQCRFLWKRWEQFDLTLCNQALPAALEGGAAWIVAALSALMIVVLHYKIWRHLLDNKIVGEELEKFSKKYGYLQTRS